VLPKIENIIIGLMELEVYIMAYCNKFILECGASRGCPSKVLKNPVNTLLQVQRTEVDATDVAFRC
jgi:hypothetical protein